MKKLIKTLVLAMAPAAVLAAPGDLPPPMPPIPLASAAPFAAQTAPTAPAATPIHVASPPPSTGAGRGNAQRGDLPSQQYFAGPNPVLTAREKKALSIAKRWQQGGPTAMMPTAGRDGTIRFAFGTTQPSIVCAVLQVCDVELQPGEQVNSINLGDSARWLVEPAITGAGATQVQHLIIKPQDVGLETSLVVTTDRRT